MARKTVLLCDGCGVEIGEGAGGEMRFNPVDARKSAKLADVCEGCAAGLPGRAVPRRGRKPRAVAA